MEQVLELMHMCRVKTPVGEGGIVANSNFSYTFSWANVWGHKFGYTALPSVIGNKTLI